MERKLIVIELIIIMVVVRFAGVINLVKLIIRIS